MRVSCASVFDLFDNAGKGSFPLAPARQGTGEVRLVEVKDVVLLPSALETGQSISVIGGSIVPKESFLDCWNLDFFKAQRRLQPHFQAKYAGEFAVERREEPVCILANLFSRNFGHWTEELLKVALLESAQIQCRYVLANLPSFAARSLEFLGVPPERIDDVTSPTRFSRVLYTTAIGHGNIAQYPSALQCLRELIDVRLGGLRSNCGPRLWLERKTMVGNGGLLVNQEQTHELLRAYDFQFIDMAELSVAEQFAAARGARVLAGLHGAQSVHCQFMPSRSTLIECFSPTHVNPSVLEICRVLGHSYHHIVSRSHVIAPYEYGRDCEVDCERLSLVLSTLNDTLGAETQSTLQLI